jgi:hypothetical protein
MLYLDFIRYIVSYVSDLIWENSLLEGQSHICLPPLKNWRKLLPPLVLVFLFRHLCSNVFWMVTWSLIENRMWYRRKDTLRSIHNKVRDIWNYVSDKANSWGEANIYGFDLPVVNFPFLGSNIPASSAYGVYIQSWSATLEFVSNTVTSQREDSCCQKSYSGIRKFTTGRSKPYIFASPQELEKVIVPSCPGLPVPPPMFQCILEGHVKPDWKSDVIS